MSTEIERKFLVLDDSFKNTGIKQMIIQGYLSLKKENVVRIRTKNKKGFLTIKGLSVGISREEFEYEIPEKDALEMLDSLCMKPVIRKIRYEVMYQGFRWEVDEFLDDNFGLVIAELELKETSQKIVLPPWVGEEVSGDPKYYNINLVLNPFINWQSI